MTTEIKNEIVESITLYLRIVLNPSLNGCLKFLKDSLKEWDYLYFNFNEEIDELIKQSL